MKKNIFAAVLSIASLSAGTIFAVGPDSSGSSTQDYSYILDSGNSISISRFTNSPKVTGTHPEGYAITNGYKSYSGTSISAKWDYSGTVIGISTGTPYITDLTYKDGILTNAGAKISSNETAIVASRSVASGFKVFGGIRLNQVKAQKPTRSLQEEEKPVAQPQGGYANASQLKQAAQQMDPKAEAWAAKNTWFGTDNAMTYTAFDIHKKLTEEEGYDPSSEEYYQEVDKRIRLEFPQKFGKTENTTQEKPSQTVASAKRPATTGRRKTVKLTPSQVAIAKRLGVPLEKYAEQLIAKEV